MKNIIIRAAALAATIVLPAGLHAATAEGEMGVSATVSRTCTVSANALEFGTVSEVAATTASALITINCTAGSLDATPSITVSDGLNRAPEGLRRMIGGDSEEAFVPYQIAATDGGEDLTATLGVALTDGGDGITYSTTLFGEIATSVAYQIGTFGDTVTVTVTYDE